VKKRLLMAAGLGVFALGAGLAMARKHNLRGVPVWARNLPQLRDGREAPSGLTSNSTPTPSCQYGRNWMSFTRMAGSTGPPDWATSAGNAWYRSGGVPYFTSCKPAPKKGFLGGGIGSLIGGVIGSFIAPGAGTMIGSALGGALLKDEAGAHHQPGWRVGSRTRPAAWGRFSRVHTWPRLT
jgi:hypothetical protein